MNKAQFDYMCEMYGDPSLSKKDRWKSVAYICTRTTRTPTFSAQYYLKTDQFIYSENFNEPGIFLIDYQYSPFGPFTNKHGLTVTFIPLQYIISISFTPRVTFNDGSTVTPESPDVIIGVDDLDAEATNITTVITMDDEGADPDAEYTHVYDGLSANVVDDSELETSEDE